MSLNNTQSNLRNVKVVVADRTFQIQTSIEEEDRVKEAAEIIKQRLQEMKSSYDARYKDDYMAMTMLTLCVEMLEAKDELNKVQQRTNSELSKINNVLTNFLDR